VRAEEGGKLSLLGFFGAAPDVEIAVRNLDLPIPALAFVFLGGVYQLTPTDPVFEIKIRVADPKGRVIFETPPATLNLVPAGNRTMIAASIGNLRVTITGRYMVSLWVNHQSLLERTFDIRVAAPLDQRVN
jgi:hypothetical protein